MNIDPKSRQIIDAHLKNLLEEVEALFSEGKFLPVIIIGLDEEGKTDIHMPDLQSDAAVMHLLDAAKKMMKGKTR